MGHMYLYVVIYITVYLYSTAQCAVPVVRQYSTTVLTDEMRIKGRQHVLMWLWSKVLLCTHKKANDNNKNERWQTAPHTKKMQTNVGHDAW